VGLPDHLEPQVLEEVRDSDHEGRMVVGDKTPERSSGHRMGSECEGG
jgi:hypothetical protein